MSAPSKVNKENFRLLDLSSDEESEDLQLEIIPSRKKKITRRERSRSSAPAALEHNIGTEVRCALRWAVRGTLLLWLLMLTWICAALYDQVTTMRVEIGHVSRSSNSVDDALQVCHTTAKELRANASALSEKFAQLDLEHKELSQRVAQAAQDLAVVSNQLSAAPKLADTPRRLAELQRTVATFGSQINGFDSSISSTHKQALAAVAGVEEIRTLLHQLDAKANETIANVTANTKRDEDLRSDVGSLNTTLTSKIEALQIRIQEISKPVSTVPPTVPTAATAGSTAAVVNATSTTTTSVPPGKPAVLQ
ncbi:uncharacterized protein LOC110370548 isoform X2 [Helicoverpa armigera]|uniref:uncharacterized protein LOC124638090 isoform X2 n=1 Tax=Helicoverpa zea TaxID=7113 RepID=UPI001F5A185E|nr:uncharacterized protein LOC124638090 isoform X2 [Helicoverpa zea]